MVEISLYNRQRKVRIDLAWLKRLAPLLVEAVLPHVAKEDSPLPFLSEVEVTFVSDATIARVHRDFMNIPGATDVITFAHGEIIISPETALENAAHYGRSLDEELARYLIHGLLHLSGYEDQTPAEAKAMHALQERLLAGCIDAAAEGVPVGG